MADLVIIGNGFDLAHGCKTTYKHFFEYLILRQIKEKNIDPPLFWIRDSVVNLNAFWSAFKRRNTKYYIPKNNLFDRMQQKLSEANWCDVEEEYFSQLTSETNRDEPQKINNEFKVIKNCLEEYLVEEFKKNDFELNEQYELFFSRINSSDSIVLNFNYTNIVQRYIDKTNKGLKVVNVHGQLNDSGNPIIFGYAATDQESRSLSQRNDNEYMRNIKKHCYKRTNNERKLKNFLGANKKINVSILGHSCGLSDKLILNQIFNSNNVCSTRIFFYQDYENFFQIQANLDRIMVNDIKFNNLKSFQESIRMPQWTDSKEEIVLFEEFMKRSN